MKPSALIAIGLLTLFGTPSLFADPASNKTVTLFFKSYEPDVADGKPIFYITSSELPAETGDWHPGMVEKGYKLKDMVGSFKIIKFIPLESKEGADSSGQGDKSILILQNDAKPPVKVALTIGEKISVPIK